MIDLTDCNIFQLAAKDLTMRKWQDKIADAAQAAQDAVDAKLPRNDQMAQALMKIGVEPG